MDPASSSVVIVVWMVMPWNRFHRRAFLEALSHQGVLPCRLLCIDPPRGWVSPQTLSQMPAETSLQMVSGSIAVLSARTVLSHGLARALHLEQTLFSSLARTVDRSLVHLGWCDDPRICWIYSPTQWAVPGMIDESLTVYECYDQHAATGSNRGSRRRLDRDERRLLADVDLVIATSQKLVEDKSQHHQCVFHMPNAAEVGFFSQVWTDATPVAPAVANLVGKPVVGCLGTIHEGTDLELLIHVAERRPEWQLLLVGPVQEMGRAQRNRLHTLKQLPNVRFPGWVNKKALLGYCRVFDVGIIPYRLDSAFNAFVTPNKLFEYLAMALPVVCVDLPGLGEYRKYALVARTQDEFVAQIDAALEGSCPVAPDWERISWENRAELVARFLRQQLDRA